MLDDDKLADNVHRIYTSGNWLHDNYNKPTTQKRQVLAELRYMAQIIRETIAKLID